MVNAINWFEIPVTEFNRAKKFYNTIFGFEMQEQKMGDDILGYFPADKGAVSGAICQGEGYKPSADGTLVYLNADGKIDDVLGKVEKAGGKIVIPKTLVTEEIGYIACFIDTEGNKVALHSPKR